MIFENSKLHLKSKFSKYFYNLFLFFARKFYFKSYVSFQISIQRVVVSMRPDKTFLFILHYNRVCIFIFQNNSSQMLTAPIVLL